MTDMKEKAQKVFSAYYDDPQHDPTLNLTDAFREAVNQILPEEEPIFKGGMRPGYDKTWNEAKQDERQKARALFLELCEEIEKL